MDFAELLQQIHKPAPGSLPRATASTVTAEFWKAFERRDPASCGRNTGDERRAAPVRAPSVEPAEIERELGLAKVGSAEGLARARRAFARANHPDRVVAEHRPQATTRMMIANALIDAAMDRLHEQRRAA